MKITCIIPTTGARGCLRQVLQRIEAQDFPSGEFEVIVVGNLPSESLRRSVMAFRDRIKILRLIFSGRIGVNHARNCGMEVARGEVILFLDDDCVPVQKNYFSQLWRLHEENPSATAVGGFYHSAEGAGGLEKAYVEISRTWLEGSQYEKGKSFSLLGGNVSYRREQLGTLHRFDPRIRFGGAETEFHARLSRGGHEFILSELIPVTHHASLGWRDFFRRAFLQGYRWAELRESGLAPMFKVSSKKENLRRGFYQNAFQYFFQLGSDWSRICLYEDTFFWRLRELFVLRVQRGLELLRASAGLREFCHLSLFLAQERRQNKLEELRREAR